MALSKQTFEFRGNRLSIEMSNVPVKNITMFITLQSHCFGQEAVESSYGQSRKHQTTQINHNQVSESHFLYFNLVIQT